MNLVASERHNLAQTRQRNYKPAFRFQWPPSTRTASFYWGQKPGARRVLGLLQRRTDVDIKSSVSESTGLYRFIPRVEARPAIPNFPLQLLAPGPTRILHSSSSLPWNGVLIEKHLVSPGERAPSFCEMHVISMLCGRASKFERVAQDGRVTVEVGRPGTMTIIPIGPVPGVRLGTTAEFVQCALEDSFVRGVLNEMVHQPAAVPAMQWNIRNRPIERILALLMQELEDVGLLSGLYVDSLAHALAAQYLLLGHTPEERADDATSPLPAHILKRVREKIEANIQSELSLSCLAAESGYSRAHFLRMFRVATGTTPHQYVLDLRLKRAQSDLRLGKANLIDVAADCGFASHSHMTTVFRRRLGTTPAEFRRSSKA